MMLDDNEHGELIYKWVTDLFPINRSITGPGVRETLKYIQDIIPQLEIFEVPTGYKAFDWEVPEEWFIDEAWIEDEAGNKIVDFKNNNLHVVGYSIPVDKWMSLEKLNEHLYTLPNQPDAIPYVTSYYDKKWGFCITHQQKQNLEPGQYRAVIKSQLIHGVLNYGELILPGKSAKEIFLSTYICHPSMANNELSGPAIAMALVNWLKQLTDRNYTYRIIFIPETIGSIVYLSKHLEKLKQQVYAGFNMTCLGDNRCYSYLPSRNGNTISDRVAKHVLAHIDPNFKQYTWLQRGSDERQYCAPGVDLPVASIMRSKFHHYPEYHTSKDNLELVCPEGLAGGFNALKSAIEILENDKNYLVTVYGEPQLGKRGLYSNTSIKGSTNATQLMMNLISYCDGKHSLLDIAEILNVPFKEILVIAEKLSSLDILKLRE